MYQKHDNAALCVVHDKRSYEAISDHLSSTANRLRLKIDHTQFNETTINLKCKLNHSEPVGVGTIVFTPHCHTLNSPASFCMLAQQV